MKGIKIVAMVVMVTALASCGTLRNKHKSSAKLEVIEGAKVEQTSQEQSSTMDKVKEREQDRGTVVTERETTTVTTKPSNKGTATIKKGELKPGENFIPMDSAVGLIKAVLDTLKGTLTIEIDQPSERTEQVVKERITERKDVTKEREQERKDTTSKQVAIQAEQSRRETSTESSSESKPNILAVLMSKIGWGIAFAIVVIAVFIYFRIKRR